MQAQEHWDAIYSARGEDQVSWFEPDPAMSLAFVRRAFADGAKSVIDVGGGVSRLVDRLLEEGAKPIAVLDISNQALDLARNRLRGRAERVRWIAGDVTALDDVGTYDVWHDRAVFHFLTDLGERARYRRLAERTVPRGGYAVVATFAPQGPERCSGLEVCRYGAGDLSAQLGSGFDLLDSASHVHATPRGVEQPFTYALFLRT